MILEVMIRIFIIQIKKAYKEGKSIVDVAHEETGISKSELEKLLDTAKLTKGGISG